MARKIHQTGRGETRWRGIIREQRHSGLSIHKFCRAHRLGESTFYLWRRRLARRKEALARSRPRPSVGTAAFVPVQVVAASAKSGGRMDILLPYGGRVRVTPPVDGPALAEVLAVLAKRTGEQEGRGC